MVVKNESDHCAARSNRTVLLVTECLSVVVVLTVILRSSSPPSQHMVQHSLETMLVSSAPGLYASSIKLVITGLGFSQPPQILQLCNKMNSAISNLFVREPHPLSKFPGEILHDELQSPIKFLNSKLQKSSVKLSIWL